ERGERLAEFVTVGRESGLGPEELHQHVPGMRAVEMEGQVGEQSTGLPRWEAGEGPLTLQNLQPAEQLDPAARVHRVSDSLQRAGFPRHRGESQAEVHEDLT